MKLLTLNLKHFLHGDWEKRLPVIVKTIIEYDCDILAFQDVRGLVEEVDNNMVKQLQDALKEAGNEYFWVVVQPVMRRPGPPDNWEGMAILSRISFIDSGCKPLPIGEGEDKSVRNILWGRYQLGNQFFYVFNNYYSFDELQAVEDANNSHAVTNGCPEHAFFLGDMRFGPDSDVYKNLVSNGWVDIWKEIRGNDPGLNNNPENPTDRTIYIFRNKEMNFSINDIKIIFDKKDSEADVYSSDKCGLLVDFSNPE